MNATMQIPTTGWNPGIMNSGANGQNRVAEIFGNPATGVFPYASYGVNAGYSPLLTGFPQGTLGPIPFGGDPNYALNAFTGINFMHPNLLNLIPTVNQIPIFNPVSPIPLTNTYINPLTGYTTPFVNPFLGGINPYVGLPINNLPVNNPLTPMAPALVPNTGIPTFGGVPYNVSCGFTTPLGTQMVNTVAPTPLMNPGLTTVGHPACTIPVQSTTPIWNHPGIPFGQPTIPLTNLANMPSFTNVVGNPWLANNLVAIDPVTGTKFVTLPTITPTPTIIPTGGTIPNTFNLGYPINHPFWGGGANWNVSALAPGNWLGNSPNWRPNFPFPANPYAIGNNPILANVRGWNPSSPYPFATNPNWSCAPPIGVTSGIPGLNNVNPLTVNPAGLTGCAVC